MSNNDWCLWIHSPVDGKDFIRSHGCKTQTHEQMKTLDAYGCDVWLIDPDGNKHLPSTPLPQDIEKPSCKTLQSKPTQIQAASQPGDGNSGPHVQLFALCEDGSIWVQYYSSGFSNVPTDGLWHVIQQSAGW